MDKLVENIMAVFSRREVRKAIPLQIDVGHLMATDINVMGDGETELLRVACENTQLLLEAVIGQEGVDDEEGFAVRLPARKLEIPREKPLPNVSKPETKWSAFAKRKGIRRKEKRSSRVFDDVRKEWKPRYGSKSMKHDSIHNWVEELN